MLEDMSTHRHIDIHFPVPMTSNSSHIRSHAAKMRNFPFSSFFSFSFMLAHFGSAALLQAYGDPSSEIPAPPGESVPEVRESPPIALPPLKKNSENTFTHAGEDVIVREHVMPPLPRIPRPQSPRGVHQDATAAGVASFKLHDLNVEMSKTTRQEYLRLEMKSYQHQLQLLRKAAEVQAKEERQQLNLASSR